MGEKQPGSAATPLRWQISMIAGRKIGLTTKRAPASMTRAAVCAIEDGARSEQDAAGSVGRQTANQIDGAGHGHRHFERADAAVGQRVDDGAEAIRLLHADDGDDARLFDRRGHVLSLVAHRASHPPSTART